MSALPKFGMSHIQLDAMTITVCAMSSNLFEDPIIEFEVWCGRNPWGAQTRQRTPFLTQTLAPNHSQGTGLTINFKEALSL